MRKILLANVLTFFGFFGSVMAQADSGQSFSLEQQRIDLLKQQTGVVFDVMEQSCADRFAVNDCLKDVKRRRLARMAEIKREELVLHNAQRKQRGIDQNASTEEKAKDRLSLEQENAAVDPASSTEAKRIEQIEKQRSHAALANAAVADQPVKAASSGLTTAEESENRAAYLQKLQDAEQKRKERAKRLLEKGSVRPLPP